MLSLAILLIYAGIAIWAIQVYRWLDGEGWQNVTLESVNLPSALHDDAFFSLLLAPLNWSVGLDLILLGLIVAMMKIGWQRLKVRLRARRRAKYLELLERQQQEALDRLSNTARRRAGF